MTKLERIMALSGLIGGLLSIILIVALFTRMVPTVVEQFLR